MNFTSCQKALAIYFFFWTTNFHHGKGNVSIGQQLWVANSWVVHMEYLCAMCVACVCVCVFARMYAKHETVCQWQVDRRVRCFVRRFIGLHVHTLRNIRVRVCMSYSYGGLDIFSWSARLKPGTLFKITLNLQRAAEKTVKEKKQIRRWHHVTRRDSRWGWLYKRQKITPDSIEKIKFFKELETDLKVIS